ncbi:MAG: hypothetical protein KC776_11275 [Myxococcales bacterium]|nr:hypothetical protein [Myxococcales bacterium]
MTRVLLSDGSGLTSRQVATRLAVAGHTVGAQAPNALVLTRFTGWARACHGMARSPSMWCSRRTDHASST